MTEYQWRLEYAPNGYRFAKTRITFEALDRERFLADRLAFEVDSLRRQMEQEIDGRFYASVFTRVTIYPKDVGESLNHLDPLRPRFGIEIEMRQPAAAPLSR